MEVQGTIKEIGKENQITEKFCKREMVIITDEKYPQTILVQFINASTDLPDPYNQGDEVKVSCNLQGKEWVNPSGETKYFLSLNGWKIEKLSESNQDLSNQQFETTNSSIKEDINDLPF